MASKKTRINPADHGMSGDEFTVTTRERAVARGLRPCPGECAGTAWYWWVEGESLLGGSE